MLAMFNLIPYNFFYTINYFSVFIKIVIINPIAKNKYRALEIILKKKNRNN